jgi:hypothetical protein
MTRAPSLSKVLNRSGSFSYIESKDKGIDLSKPSRTHNITLFLIQLVRMRINMSQPSIPDTRAERLAMHPRASQS